MEDKTNLYVFSKKEVILIFFFMVLIAGLSFVLGVKVGKSFTLNDEGMNDSNIVKTIELHSKLEEKVNEMTNPEVEESSEKPKETVSTAEESRKLLEEEAKKVASGEFNTEKPKSEVAVKSAKETVHEDNSLQGKYKGKFTIQLGSYKELADAEKFSDGFRVRGYNPIIYEVELADKGTWYRVNLGVFDSVNETKEYILQEKSLFQNQDYVIGRFE